MIPFLTTTASFAGLTVLMLLIKPLRNIVRLVFTKLAIFSPFLIGYAFMIKRTGSVIASLLVGVLLLIVSTVLYKNQTIKFAVKFCSCGLAACIAFCLFDIEDDYFTASAFFVYFMAFIVIWVVMSAANIMLDKDESYFNGQMSFNFYTASMVISTLFTYVVIGIHGVFRLPVVNNFPEVSKTALGLIISALVSFFVVGLLKKLLLFRTVKGFSSSKTQNSVPKSKINVTDYQMVKNNLEELKKAVDRCYDNIDKFGVQEQEDILSSRRIFYSLCSEFQKSQTWGPAEDATYHSLKQKYLKYWDTVKKNNKTGGKADSKYEKKTYSQAPMTDIGKALALFMFDSLEDVTEEKLKKQRNMLLKAYHPDEGVVDDTYSQRINTAYSLIKECL